MSDEYSPRESLAYKFFIESVEELYIEFAKYCHDESCEYPLLCPRYHNTCSKNLDLDTAIAWEIHNILKNVYIIFETHYPHFNKYHLYQLASALSSLENLGTVVKYHSDNPYYERLINLIGDLDVVLNKFRNILFTYGVII